MDNADVVGECSVHRESVMLSELDDCTFKTPQKRRLEQSHSDEQAKKGFICDVSQTDTESENDFSECSAPCSSPQSRSSSKSYSADDIKSFLKETKNMRKVCIEQYFPDVIQFLDKVRMYRNEGCFSNQEVYRLKEILAKLNTHLEFLFVKLILFLFFLYYSLNINGAREGRKRFQLFELVKQKSQCFICAGDS